MTTPKTYHAGSLTYTKPALIILFFWLLWGDFCYTVMEAAYGPIMQLKFAALGASNTERTFFCNILPGIIYSCLAPVIAYRSDRYRSPRGRRIPFLLYSLPFLVFFLVCLGFGEPIGQAVFRLIAPLAKGITVSEVQIVTFGLLLVAFAFFNAFTSTTFWYLFNDVVPEPLLARFFSWFRLISTGSTSLYYFAVFPSSRDHATAIFLGAALLYAVGFGLMCFNVREGTYPLPSPFVEGKTGPIAALKTFGVETHAYRHYWYLWLNVFLGGIAGAVGASNIFFWTAIGLSLSQIGEAQGIYSIVVAILTLGSAWLADRVHPIRVVIFSSFFAFLLVHPFELIWLFWHPDPAIAFPVFLMIQLVLRAPAQAMANLWDPPFLMRFLPRSHYGQFCSVNGVWRMVGGIIGSLIVGIFLDQIGRWVGPQRAYLYLPLWQLVFSIPCLFLQVKLYQSWKRHGGDAHYAAPVLIGPTMEEEKVTPPDVA